MSMILRWSAALLATVALSAGASAAEPDEAAYRRLNDALATGYVVPRYEALAKATASLDEAAKEFCGAPDRTRLVELRRRFGAASDAWQRIQHVRFGPVEYFSRSSRFAFWPDPRNSVGRALEDLLSKSDAASLEPKAFVQGNVAMQGFPALERLVFADGAEKALMASDAPAARRCAVLQAITGNLSRMSADVHDEWIGGDRPFIKVIAAAGSFDSPYRHPREATLDFVKALHMAVELVADHKLVRPLGASAAAARPRLAEAWRSGRSLDNVRLDLAAAADLYNAPDSFSTMVRDVVGDKALDDLLKRAFTQIAATAESIGPPLESAVGDPKRRPAVEQLVRETSALKSLIADRLTAAIGIPLGFNALDGD